MQDFADRLNVSKNAFSLAHKLGYTLTAPKNTAICNNLLVMIPEYIRDDRYFYNDIYWSIENYSSKTGYNAIMTIVTPEMEQQLLLPKLCREIQFAGILLIGIMREHYVSYLHNQYKNVLSVDQSYYNLPIPCVLTANMDGTVMLTKK